ncbi:MAG: hypothetical protein N2Z20_03505 [Elusimicrobiales bacterium]|nr:hypothetical protein [Elusimicrobiales bacterium]
MLKIRESKWTDNAYVERTHRTDDEEFYIPKLLNMDNIQNFFRTAYGYVVHFNTKRPHYGKYMNESTPFEMLKRFMPNITKSISYLPPLIFDFVSSDNIMLSQTILRSF